MCSHIRKKLTCSEIIHIVIQFGFENMRVHPLKSIRNLDLSLTISIRYIGFISEKSDERASVALLIEQSKRIYKPRNFFYAIVYGLFAIFSKCKQGVSYMLNEKPKSIQLSLFSDVGFGWR